jgi:hypothetical protein
VKIVTLAEKCQFSMGEPFTINMKKVRKRLAAIGRNKSTGSDGFPGEILKLGGEAMVPCLARLLDLTIHNDAIPSDWKGATAVPINKGEIEQ